MTAFSERRGYQAQRLSWWRKRLGSDGDGGAPAITLAPAVVTRDVQQPAVVVSVEASAVTLEVLDAAAVPASWVAQVASSLRTTEAS